MDFQLFLQNAAERPPSIETEKKTWPEKLMRLYWTLLSVVCLEVLCPKTALIVPPYFSVVRPLCEDLDRHLKQGYIKDIT